MATKKRTGFGGTLLGTPQPLPDEDDAPMPVRAPQPPAAAVEVAEEARAAEPEPEPAPAPGSRPAVRQKAAQPPSEAQPTPPAAKSAPGTLRLNDVAGAALWAAYLEAKASDPFLSYRQFASNVVIAGLDRR